jgi:thiol-disulfide isomerase/thioredoxin
MKKILSLSAFLLISLCLSAQINDGAESPDFNLDDIDGNNHQLFADYLDNTKHVILDFSATWCPPCWIYHTSGALETFYEDHGPNGDDVAMVIMMEADETTNTNCLFGPVGCNNSTEGDWVTGTEYPIINAPDATTRMDFSISFWPTVYMVNGFDNRIFEVGQANAATLSNWLTSFDLEVSTATVNNHDCQNLGSIELDIVGGYNTLGYVWSNGSIADNISDLEEGDYYVTITDANGYFIERGPYTVFADNSNPDFNIIVDEQENVSCHGEADGFVNIIASGNNVSYLWSNGSTSPNSGSLNAGTHSLIVSNDIGCIETQAYSITEPAVLEMSSFAIDPNCDNTDGEIQLTATGGTTPYNFQLDGNLSSNGFFNNLGPGIYTPEVLDNNLCLVTMVVELTGSPIPTAMTSVTELISCNNSEVMISGVGSSTGSNFSYEWKDEAGVIIATTLETTVDAAGDYTLAVVDNTGCSSTAMVNVQEDFTEPTISTTDGVLTCSESEVEICLDAAGAESYFWIINGEQINDLCVMVQSAGDYVATAIASNGCQSTSISTVSVDTDIPNIMIAEPQVLTCVLTSQVLTAELVGQLSDFSTSWTTDNGSIIGSSSLLNLEIDGPGTYNFSATNNITGCEAITTVVVEEFINTPEASFTADNDDDFLYLSGFGQGNPSSWQWIVDGVQAGNMQDLNFPLSGELSIDVCLQIFNECGMDEFCNTVSITEPLTIEVVIENIACYGESTGSINIDPIGGVAPYSTSTVGPNGFVSATQNLSNLPAGIYQITVNDSETRITMIEVTIGQNPALELSGMSINPLCFDTADGNINLDISGGSGNYTYLWSNGSTTQNLSNIPAGDYSVEITDDVGCSISESFTLAQSEEIVQSGVTQDVSCFGEDSGSIVLSISGGTGNLNLEWNDENLEGISNTNLPPGSYTLNITDENGCNNEQTYTISEPEELVYNLVSIENDFDGNGGAIDVDVSGGVSPYEYLWSHGATTEDIENLPMGTYTLTVIDANNCQLLTEDYTIEFVSSVNEITDLVSFNVYPNPVKDLLNINLEMTTLNAGSIQLIDYTGKLLMSKNFASTDTYNAAIDITSYASGMYLLKVETENGIALKRVSIVK